VETAKPPTSRNVAKCEHERDHRKFASYEHWHQVLREGGLAHTAVAEVAGGAWNWMKAPHFGGIVGKDGPSFLVERAHTPASRKQLRYRPPVALDLPKYLRCGLDFFHVYFVLPQSQWRYYDAHGDAASVYWLGSPHRSAKHLHLVPMGVAVDVDAPFSACFEDSIFPPVGKVDLDVRGVPAPVVVVEVATVGLPAESDPPPKDP